jgi:hypothetical protein
MTRSRRTSPSRPTDCNLKDKKAPRLPTGDDRISLCAALPPARLRWLESGQVPRTSLRECVRTAALWTRGSAGVKIAQQRETAHSGERTCATTTRDNCSSQAGVLRANAWKIGSCLVRRRPWKTIRATCSNIRSAGCISSRMRDSGIRSGSISGLSAKQSSARNDSRT